MPYTIVRLLSTQEISPFEKKEYISSLYEDYQNRHVENKRFLGFLTKFSYALGFKKYESLTVNDKYFTTPNKTISERIYAYPFGNVICDFYVENGTTNALDDSYSYDNREMAYKWADFLRKVFPELSVTLSESTEKPNRETFIVSHVFQSIEDYPVSIECSLDSMPTESEMNAVKAVINLYKDEPLKFKVFSFFCKTCEEYHSDHPIHFEVDYWYNEERRKENSLTYQGSYDGPTCFNCSDKLIEDYQDDLCEDCRTKLKDKILLEVN